MTVLNEEALGNIPEELRDRPQWVVHRKKIPHNPRTKRKASTTDPRTWSTLDDALHALRGGRFDGLGFVFTEDDPFIGIDLDHVRDPDTGEIEPWALEIIEALGTYTEISPSGTGIHIICAGRLPGPGRKRGQTEVYDRARYFTMTGILLEDTAPSIGDRQKQAEELWNSLGKPQAAATPLAPGEHPLDGVPEGQRDHELYRYACRLESRGLDRREVEALVLMAARNCDPPFPEAEALTKVAGAWKFRERSEPSPAPRVISWNDLDAQEHEPLRWVLEGLLPEGLTIVAGRPKAGKSWLALQMAASVALGRNLLEPDCDCQAGEVLVLALEDSERRLKDRMRAILSMSWDAQVSRNENGKPRVRFPHGMAAPPNSAHFATEWPRIGEGFEEHLLAFLDEHPDTRLVVVDILERVVNRERGQGAYQVDYAAIRPLHELARSRRVGVVVVHHTRKPTKDLKEDRVGAVSGSYGLTASADVVMVLERSGRGEGKLLVTGRDIEEEQDYAVIQSEGGMWSIVGEGEAVTASGSEQEILDCLALSPGMTPTAIAAHFGGRWTVSTVKTFLTRLKKKEMVIANEHGQYRAIMLFSNHRGDL